MEGPQMKGIWLLNDHVEDLPPPGASSLSFIQATEIWGFVMAASAILLSPEMMQTLTRHGG